jgi:predicted regulator of Ras-like GTPase activity (Roadblock/LC7/MglB family)
MGIAYNKVAGETAENISAQMALVVQVSRRSAQRLDNSQVEDVQVTSDKSYLIGRFLGDNEHFVFVNVNRDSVLGNVRLVMRNYSDRLLKAVPK